MAPGELAYTEMRQPLKLDYPSSILGRPTRPQIQVQILGLPLNGNLGQISRRSQALVAQSEERRSEKPKVERANRSQGAMSLDPIYTALRTPEVWSKLHTLAQEHGFRSIADLCDSLPYNILPIKGSDPPCWEATELGAKVLKLAIPDADVRNHQEAEKLKDEIAASVRARQDAELEYQRRVCSEIVSLESRTSQRSYSSMDYPYYSGPSNMTIGEYNKQQYYKQRQDEAYARRYERENREGESLSNSEFRAEYGRDKPCRDW